MGSGIYQRHWPLRMLDGDCELPHKAESMVSPLVGHQHSYLPVGFKLMPGILSHLTLQNSCAVSSSP